MSVGLILNLLHNVILFNEFNKYSNEPVRIWYSIYHIPPKEFLIVKIDHFASTRLFLLYNDIVLRAFDAMFVRLAQMTSRQSDITPV